MTDQDATPGGEERNASTLELFFDLVYVYAITQVVAAIHGDASPAGLAKGAFLLALLWWTWSIYTWTTNWTGTDGTPTRLFLLAAMGTTLFMAVAVPDAFGDSSAQFGVAYFMVRILALGFYWVASKDFPAQRESFFTFGPISMAAAALVLVGGFLPTPWLWTLWIASALLDLVSALNAGRGTWTIDAKHFAERFGLFIIIALGESVVGIGFTATDVPRDAVHTAAFALAFIIAAGLWWSYFDKAAPYVEARFTALHGKARGRFARDGYSLLHYPIVVGIVFFAVAAEDIVAHPSDVLEPAVRFAFTSGVALVLLGMVATGFRAVHRIGIERTLAAVVILGVGVVGASLEALTIALIVAAVLIGALVWEHVRAWSNFPPLEIGADTE
ncbi:MAG: low temperature requirement protein A [Actinomycetia bacterium]|nr:low temperature requirement protein A [Actinomycetes bacterium]